ncbi:hypothetical protein [Rhodohalobacter halophilus]|uniref:hypothetical protein n=1 Tax=Rhodohalobacter halophilus TaxID=1812810 RepID=UPI00083F64BD|nr:hypothetical protein [Rhodohalobacter halophilus]
MLFSYEQSFKTEAQHNHTNYLIFLIIPLLLFSGCNLTGGEESVTTFESDFNSGETDWEPFYTGYPVSYEENMEFESEIRPLPDPLNSENNGYYITAFNRSDDVKMLFRNQVNGLEPNRTYRVHFTVRFATETPSNCAGVGGAPGETVKVIADASDIRPEPIIEGEADDGYVLLNTQQMGNPQEWYQNAIMGNIANSRDCEEGYGFEIKEVQSGRFHAQVTTDEFGNAWLLFGTRSGFEGKTNLYYTYFRAEFIN